MASTGDRDRAIAALEALAERRVAHQREAKDLAADVRETVERAQAVLPMAEIARRLGIDRSTLYRTYLGE